MIAIKRKRKSLKLTQTELANKIGVTAACISSWEKGRTEPNIVQIKGLCKVFKCSFEKLTEEK